MCFFMTRHELVWLESYDLFPLCLVVFVPSSSNNNEIAKTRHCLYNENFAINVDYCYLNSAILLQLVILLLLLELLQ